MKGYIMLTFEVVIRIGNYQTANVRLQADNHGQAKMLAEAQYGAGNVITYREIS